MIYDISKTFRTIKQLIYGYGAEYIGEDIEPRKIKISNFIILSNIELYIDYPNMV